jgi:class 3 adenylate cyclase
MLEVEVGSHIGIDARTVLVRKLGLQPRNGRTDRQNEVWAGRPVNMAAKLASLSDHNQILVSDRFYKLLDSDLVLKSCGCPDGERKPLWEPVDLKGDSRFDFATAHLLKSNWCEKHGRQFCEDILALEDDDD